MTLDRITTVHSIPEKVRKFATGATRDLDDSKLDFEGFLSPRVVQAFGEYMHKHRQTAEGLRPSDNWQLGIPKDAYIKSLMRHVVALWRHHRGVATEIDGTLEDALAGVYFNNQGYWHEHLLKQSHKEEGA